MLQFLPEEIEAAVLAALDRGTRVMAHVCTRRGIRRCLKAGVRSIEHGQLTDEDTVRLMADAEAVRNMQPFIPEPEDVPRIDPARLARKQQRWGGTDTAICR